MSLPRKPHECGIFLAESKESRRIAYPKHMALGDSVNNSADLWGVRASELGSRWAHASWTRSFQALKAFYAFELRFQEHVKT